MAGISSSRGGSRRSVRLSGVALWSSAQGISSAVSGPPTGRIVERRDRRSEAITEEDPAAPDALRRKIAAPCELVDGRARYS
jgi:hypothetical protein